VSHRDHDPIRVEVDPTEWSRPPAGNFCTPHPGGTVDGVMMNLAHKSTGDPLDVHVQCYGTAGHAKPSPGSSRDQA
jgi:hypothetical protein